MGTTASNWSVGGALTVTGASTLTGATGITGAATLSSTLNVTGAATLSSTLAVTGAATLSSTLAVTGWATFADVVGVGPAAYLASPNDWALAYSFMYFDGTDIVVAGIKAYDTTTAAYRRVYLSNGSWVAV